MEQAVTCKVVRAVFKDDVIMQGYHSSEFTIEGDNPITVQVEQAGMRAITVSAENEEYASNLCDVLNKMIRLLMLFDGMFTELVSFEMASDGYTPEDVLRKFEREYIEYYPSYHHSAGYCTVPLNKLMEFDQVLNAEVYNTWSWMTVELDVVHRMYMSALMEGGLPVDLKCALLIQQADPLVELVRDHKHYFASLTPGFDTHSLMTSLDVLISKYGTEIFAEELKYNYKEFIRMLESTGDRLTHIKRAQRNLVVSGDEPILYSMKMSLLYRVVLFDLLGIDKSVYMNSLVECVKFWDNWDGVLARSFKKY
ncbi:MAG: hypothetical protein IJP28_04610 [Erysipelotrichales bacterium]|nr:hypothetical protein [Erysipelotrichales bacterium]